MVTIPLFPRTDLPAALVCCRREGWRPFSLEFERAHPAITAPGVTPVVAQDAPGPRAVSPGCESTERSRPASR